MEYIDALITYIATFFTSIWEWLNVTIVEILKDFVEWLVTSLTIGFINTKIYLLELGWSVAENVMSAFGVSAALSSAANGISPQVGYYVNLFGIMEGVGLILQAYIAAFVLRMVGF